MPSLLDLRRRIRAVKSTQQITKAMKMISASKLRRAQERVVGARPFALQMQRVLNSLASRVDPSIASAAGGARAGTAGADATRSAADRRHRRQRALRRLQHQHHQGGERLHQQGRASPSRLAWSAARGATSSSAAASKYASKRSASFSGSITPTPSGSPTRAIEEFTSGRVAKVFIVYNEFKSVMQQRVTTEQLLPIPKQLASDPGAAQGGQTPKAPVTRGRRLHLRAGPGADSRRPASEAHRDSGVSRAARVGRRRARGADDGDGCRDEELRRDHRHLTLYMNKVRQAAITREIIEVVSGASAARAGR